MKGGRALKSVRGVVTLADKRPDLLIDWDYDKNDKLPTEISYGAKYKAHWKCHTCGYEWVTTVNSRTSQPSGVGCRKCSEKVRISKFSQAIAKKNSEEQALNFMMLKFARRNVSVPILFRCPFCSGIWHNTVEAQLEEAKCPHCGHHD